MDIVKKYQNYLINLSRALDELDQKQLEKLYKAVNKRVGSKQTIFICGNGGSAATAAHMSCDFSKTSLGKKTRNPNTNLRALSLNESVPILTAWANDMEYKHIFSEQLQNLGNAGDLLITVSASGNSQNILEVIGTAKNMAIETFGLVGFGGGKAKKY